MSDPTDDQILAKCLIINEAEIRRLKAENARMRKIIDGCDWYWPADDTSVDCCALDPFETFDGDTGEVYEVSRGVIVETRFYAVLPPAEDSDSDDDFFVDEATQEAAQAAVDAEMARRSPAELLEGESADLIGGGE